MKTRQVLIKGRPVEVSSLSISGTEIVASGGVIRLARVADEWYAPEVDPRGLIEAVRHSGLRADLFTFWQRFPDSEPKYDFYRESDNVAAIPVTDYDRWFKSQIDENSRRRIKRAKKLGIDTRAVEYDDDLVAGITAIFNETPLRQGKPFWHYGKSGDAVHREMSLDAEKSQFIGAYYEGELIGFIKMLHESVGTRIVQILSHIRHRDKSPTNALIAKAVELCAAAGVRALIYEKYDYGKFGNNGLTDFKRRNGFEKVIVPQYYVPLSALGKVVLQLRLHHGLRGLLPKKAIDRLLQMRTKWYALKYNGDGSQAQQGDLTPRKAPN